MAKVGRNDPCPCGSGRKYKGCHEKVTRKMIALNTKSQKKKKMLTQQGLVKCFLKLVVDAGGSIDISCSDVDAMPKDEILGIKYDIKKDSFIFEKVKVVKKSPIITADKRIRLPGMN